MEDWDRHERGEGYRNKSNLRPSSSSSPSASGASGSSATDKKNGKPKLRPGRNVESCFGKFEVYFS